MSALFTTLPDSGERQRFESGAQRDIQLGKGRFDLISPFELVRRAIHMELGALKYDAWNWAKGMPYSRFYDSMMRHATKWFLGDRSEDHLAAICFNAGALMHFEALPEYAHFDDIPKFPGAAEVLARWQESIRQMNSQETPR